MIIGVWLAVVGGCDLLRAAHDATTRRRRLLLLAMSTSALVLAWLLLDQLDEPTAPRPSSAVLILWVALAAGWILTSSAALDPVRSDASRARWRLAAFLVFATALGGFTLVQLAAPPLPAVADDGRLSRVALTVVAGVLLLQLSTANLVIRMVLDAVGVPATAGEKRLKGGRLLGPMERVLLVGLGLAGELGAAAIVVAAKGLLRYPELRRSGEDEGPTDLSEYFLIGSFASWLCGVAGYALVRLVLG